MTLRDVLLGTGSVDDEATIFVAAGRPVTLSSSVLVTALGEHDEAHPEAAGMRELMDVWHLRDVLKGLEQRQRHELGRPTTQDELLERFVLFLTNDA